MGGPIIVRERERARGGGIQLQGCDLSPLKQALIGSK